MKRTRGKWLMILFNVTRVSENIGFEEQVHSTSCLDSSSYGVLFLLPLGFRKSKANCLENSRFRQTSNSLRWKNYKCTTSKYPGSCSWKTNTLSL